MKQTRQSMSSVAKVFISVIVVGHLLAVVIPPLSLQARGPLGLSPAVSTLMSPLERYSQFLYIDRGYAFFAPDPGPSHLIQAAIDDPLAGRTEIMIPDLQQHWPRLLYHRHFMLAEYLNEIYEPPGPPPELLESDPELARQWAQSRARYEAVRESIVKHLEERHPGSQVAIRRIEHVLPGVIEFQEDPIELNDPRLYRVLLDAPIEFDDPNEWSANEPIPVPSSDQVFPADEQIDDGTGTNESSRSDLVAPRRSSDDSDDSEEADSQEVDSQRNEPSSQGRDVETTERPQ